MMKVAAFLRSRIAHLLSIFRHPRILEMEAAPGGVLAAPAKALSVAPDSASPHSVLVCRSNAQPTVFLKSTRRPAALVRALAATLSLSIMTACGGGWGGITTEPPVITTQPVSQTVTVGQTATFTVTATGTGPLSYQWYDNGTAVTGATSSTYTTPATSTTDTGSIYTVTVTNAGGTVTSMPATLTVAASSTTVNPNAPLIVTQPANQTVPVGQTATFSVTATGSATLTYQWFKGGVAITGATSSTYTTPATVTGDSGSLFTVTVTNSLGNVTSAPATLTVTTVASTAPVITKQPVSETVTVGQTGTFSVTASGTGPLSYQWYLGGVAIPGATSSTYTTPTTVSGNSGSIFTVTVTNSAGTVTSTPATLTVNSAPLIVTPPANQTVTAGQTATFSVTASGTAPLTYQWSKNGTAIPGATSSTYTTPATVLGDSGSLFSVTVTNTTGSATGGPATLTVNTAPIITTQPANQTVNPGQTATFNVTASGPGTLTYQWSKNGTTIPGANSNTYTTPPAVNGDNGSLFTVTVANQSGSVTSGPATLTVNTAPTITTQPASQTITVGQTATFNVVAAGSPTLTYQWFKGGILIAGATSSTYTTPVTTAANVSQFTVTVTNQVGTVTSNAATLTVNNPVPLPPSLTCNSSTPPFNGVSTLTPTFSSGTAVIGSTGVGSVDITASAISGHGYTTPILTSAETYTLSVTGTGGTVVSASCTVTPTKVTISSISPANATIAPGKQTFTATVSGGATDTLTWTATAGTFAGNVWTSPNTIGTYTITATSVDEPSVSTSTTVTVSAPVITTQPSSESVCTNSATTLSVVASYATSYQWNFNGTPIPGAISSSYLIPSAVAMDAGSYTVTVSNAAGSVTSHVANVVVGSSITTNPISLAVHATQTATFSVAATGDAPFTYQWYVIAPGLAAGTAITGATSNTYTTPTLTTNSNGARYYAIVTDSCAALTSTSATLVVVNGNTPPTILTQPVSQTVAIGATATFTVVAAGSPTLTYQWYRIPVGSVTGTAISGATSTSYTVPAAATKIGNDGDAYYVIVTNPFGQALSQSATLAVGSGILITKQPTNVFVNAGASATFSVTATSTLPLTYQWYEAAPGSSTFTAIAGATGASYTQASTATTDSGSVFYVVVSNGSTPSVTSSSASLFVGPLTGINNLCNGWTWLGNAQPPTPGCSIQLAAATFNQSGEIVWPNLISTTNVQLSFTITTSDASTPPADGFALVFGDPSLGATLTTVGDSGSGLGAEGIPGAVLAFDDFENQGDPPIPYLGIERGEPALWEHPFFNLNTDIPALAAPGETISHSYVVSLVQGLMTVTMDGTQVFSGAVTIPPVAYLYFTASTGTFYEQTVISNLSATVSAP